MKMKLRDYITKVLNGMALGLFSSLIIGLILKQIGTFTNLYPLVLGGKISQYMMGPAIGAGVAYSLNASPLGIFSCIITGAIGANTVTFTDSVPVLHIGEPVGALIASLVSAEISKLVSGKTKLDIIVIPLTTIISGTIIATTIAPVISRSMTYLGYFINTLTELHPLPMGLLVAVFMGIILTLPISSAALSISLGLSGLAAGAATVGCACQMVGFAISSYRENKVGGLISQGLGTSMLQVPNIIKNPWIWLPQIIASAILGPLSTMVFKMTNNKIGAGMGTSGLVGQFATLDTMGEGSLYGIGILHFILPALICFFISEYMRKTGLIKFGDMKL
ncbi:PTS transporter subunit IIC [Anaeromicrobium sediminis]|nr:PTS sugar transporter subunit IIC [Anaeromicrobium sediminis]